MVKTLEDKLAALSPERRSKVEARTAELIAEEMSLRELRRAMGKTQAKLAADLGVGQDSVARYEQRSDMLLSTLTHYIRMVGGTLELTARFPDRKPIRIGGFGELTASGVMLPAAAEAIVSGARNPAAKMKAGAVLPKRADTRNASLRKGSSPGLPAASYRSDAKVGNLKERRVARDARTRKSG